MKTSQNVTVGVSAAGGPVASAVSYPPGNGVTIMAHPTGILPWSSPSAPCPVCNPQQIPPMTVTSTVGIGGSFQWQDPTNKCVSYDRIMRVRTNTTITPPEYSTWILQGITILEVPKNKQGNLVISTTRHSMPVPTPLLAISLEFLEDYTFSQPASLVSGHDSLIIEHRGASKDGSHMGALLKSPIIFGIKMLEAIDENSLLAREKREAEAAFTKATVRLGQALKKYKATDKRLIAAMAVHEAANQRAAKVAAVLLNREPKAAP